MVEKDVVSNKYFEDNWPSHIPTLLSVQKLVPHESVSQQNGMLAVSSMGKHSEACFQEIT